MTIALVLFIASCVMIISSIFGKILKKKKEDQPVEEEKEAENLENRPASPRIESKPQMEREEKELIKSELKAGPFTEKFFDLAPARPKKDKEEKEE